MAGLDFGHEAQVAAEQTAYLFGGIASKLACFLAGEEPYDFDERFGVGDWCYLSLSIYSEVGTASANVFVGQKKPS